MYRKYSGMALMAKEWALHKQIGREIDSFFAESWCLSDYKELGKLWLHHGE